MRAHYFGLAQLRRILLIGVMFVALLFALLAQTGAAHATIQHSDSGIGQFDEPADNDNSDLDHGLFHCVSHSCASSYINGLEFAGAFVTVLSLHQILLDWAFLPVYLKFDPPVPRNNFLKT